MKTNRIGLLAGCLALLPVLAFADLVTITNGAPWGYYRTNINENTLQTNTNTWNTVANAANNSSTSNAFVVADAVLSNTLAVAYTIAYTLADTSVSNGMTTAYTLADTAVSNGLVLEFTSADTAVSNGVTTAYTLADTAVSNGLVLEFTSADTSASNGITTAYTASDTTVSNGLTTAYETAIAGATNEMLSAQAVTNISQAVVAASDVTNLVSGSATSGHVPTADGAGGISWAAQSGGGGGGSVYYPVNPSELIIAFPFDGYMTNDWWGGHVSTNNGAAYIGFNDVRGNYLTYSNGNYAGITSPSVSTLTNWSISTWFKANNLTGAGGGVWFFRLIDSEDEVVLYLDTSTEELTYTVDTWDGAAQVTAEHAHSVAESAQTNWMHVGLVMDGADIFAYYNGSRIYTTNVSSDFDYTGLVYIGAYDGGELDPASVDNVYLYNRSLGSNEISRIYDLELNGQYGVQGLRRP